MPEKVIGLGQISGHLPSDPWVLVLGGVTREGNRRSRRAIRAALGKHLSVIWFDGFGERVGPGQQRVPLEVAVPDGSVVVVDYSQVEQAHWLNRMVEAVPSAIVTPVEMVEGSLAGRSSGRSSWLTRVRRALQRAAMVFRVKFLRRIAQIFRGMVGWNIVRDDVERLSRIVPPPMRIVYGDDFALTQGWRAARIWTGSPTSMEMPEK
jgi:hypothetical protein